MGVATMVCREARVSEIEGMAMVRRVVSYTVERCDRHKARLIVIAVDGERVCTPCIDIESVELCRRVIELYTRSLNLVTG